MKEKPELMNFIQILDDRKGAVGFEILVQHTHLYGLRTCFFHNHCFWPLSDYTLGAGIATLPMKYILVTGRSSQASVKGSLPAVLGRF